MKTLTILHICVALCKCRIWSYSAPDSVRSDVNYGSVSQNTDRVENKYVPNMGVFLPVWYVFTGNL